MEFTNSMNDFIGGNAFSLLMIVLVLAVGIGLKMTFKTPPTGDEYVHRDDY